MSDFPLNFLFQIWHVESSNGTAQEAGIFSDGGRAHKNHCGLVFRAMEDEMATYNC